LRMKVAVFAGLGLVSASLQEEFVTYVKAFNKVYTPEELFTRFQNFKDNKQMIDQHNAKRAVVGNGHQPIHGPHPARIF